MSSQSVHVRLGPALLAELDRRRKALPVTASRNSFALYLLSGALGGATLPERRPVSAETTPRKMLAEGPSIDGARLKVERIAAGLTQAMLAKMLGVSEDRVRRAEKGGVMPPELAAWAASSQVDLPGGDR